MMNTDAKDFLIFVQGYHQLFCGVADLIKYDHQNARRSSHHAQLQPHTPPLLNKTSHFDYNQVFWIHESVNGIASYWWLLNNFSISERIFNLMESFKSSLIQYQVIFQK